MERIYNNMNKKQWITFGVVSMIASTYLFSLANGWFCGFDTNADIICNARKYSYAIPAILTQFVSWSSFICAFLGDKNE